MHGSPPNLDVLGRNALIDSSNTFMIDAAMSEVLLLFNPSIRRPIVCGVSVHGQLCLKPSRLTVHLIHAQA